MTIPIEEFKEWKADDKIAYVRGNLSNYDGRIEKILGRLYQTDNLADKVDVLRGFKMRVEDFLSVPAGEWRGSALDHLPQGDPGTISQNQYNILHASAAGLAGMFYKEIGYNELANINLDFYGRCMAPINLGGNKNED